AGGGSLLVASALATRLPDDRPQPSAVASRVGETGKRILLHRAAILPGLILMGGLVTFTALNGFMPLYVEELDLGSAGPILLVYGLLVLVMRIVGSKLPDRFGTLRMTMVSLIGQAAGMFVMGWWASQFGLYAGAAVLAIGGSFLYPTLLTAAVYGVPDNERARAVSTFSLAFELSSGLGGPLLGLSASAWGTEAAFYGAAIAALASLPLLLYWSVTRPETLISPR
ncbi:MAG: MFS transporter, partial [Actinomycetota bacterium]